MPTTPRGDKAWAWVTWLTPLLSGEGYCEYQPWFRSHFKYDKAPRESKLEAWTLEHGALVQETAQAFKDAGWKVTVEHQNGFRLTGKTAVLSGKPDVIARLGQEVRVLDCKTGQPSTKDWVQVAIYLIVIPLVWKRPDLQIEGEVVYKTHATVVTHAEAVARVRDRLFALLRKIGTTPALETVPSERECGWCDITECPDRWAPVEHEPVETATLSF